VVLHLHQYRIVCAIGVCFTRGEECTRCHGRNTLPGVRLNCRGSLPEAAAYGASLALWQRRLAEQADAVIVPSAFARERLRELGAPLDWNRVHVLPPPVGVAAEESRADAGEYALVVSRLAPEKGVDVAIDACRAASIALVVAGDGPERELLKGQARGSEVRFAPERRSRWFPHARPRPSGWRRPRRWRRACRWPRAGSARSERLWMSRVWFLLVMGPRWRRRSNAWPEIGPRGLGDWSGFGRSAHRSGWRCRWPRSMTRRGRRVRLIVLRPVPARCHRHMSN